MAAKTNLGRRIVAAGILGLSVTLGMGVGVGAGTGTAHAARWCGGPHGFRYRCGVVNGTTMAPASHKWTGPITNPDGRPVVRVVASATADGAAVVQPFSHRWR
jgi:hypothetical protein